MTVEAGDARYKRARGLPGLGYGLLAVGRGKFWKVWKAILCVLTTPSGVWRCLRRLMEVEYSFSR